MTEHVAAPRTSQHPLPEIPSIDLSFRPASYFWPLGLETHLSARIKGAERKAALTRLIEARHLDEIPDFLARSDGSTRPSWVASTCRICRGTR
jgi:hypothetical protein